MLTNQAVLIAMLAAMFAGCPTINLDAQQNNRESTTKAIAGTGPVSSDANIKSANLDNQRDIAARLPAPPAKGGVRTRGGGEWCSIRVSNASALHANVYIDGEFWGTTPAYGDLAGWSRCRTMRL